MADWTEAEDKMLTYLTETGISASLIATHFPGRTRNSVIGRQHRIGLKVKAVRAAPSSMPLKPPRDHRACATINVTKLNKLRAEMQEAAKAKPEPKKAKQMHENSGAPSPLMVPLLDLEPRMCRWPCGEVGSDDFGFCGHQTPEFQSYCEFHNHVSRHGYPKQKFAEAA